MGFDEDIVLIPDLFVYSAENLSYMIGVFPFFACIGRPSHQIMIINVVFPYIINLLIRSYDYSLGKDGDGVIGANEREERETES